MVYDVIIQGPRKQIFSSTNANKKKCIYSNTYQIRVSKHIMELSSNQVFGQSVLQNIHLTFDVGHQILNLLRYGYLEASVFGMYSWINVFIKA